MQIVKTWFLVSVKGQRSESVPLNVLLVSQGQKACKSGNYICHPCTQAADPQIKHTIVVSEPQTLLVLNDYESCSEKRISNPTLEIDFQKSFLDILSLIWICIVFPSSVTPQKHTMICLFCDG